VYVNNIDQFACFSVTRKALFKACSNALLTVKIATVKILKISFFSLTKFY